MDEEPRDPSDKRTTDGHEDDDRDAILRRRRFFIASAMAGLLTASCAGSVSTGNDASPQQDTGVQPTDTGPQACLSPVLDAGPQPCLSPPIDAGPQPCLDVVFDAGTTTDS